jgi:hypothetical protein
LAMLAVRWMAGGVGGSRKRVRNGAGGLEASWDHAPTRASSKASCVRTGG